MQRMSRPCFALALALSASACGSDQKASPTTTPPAAPPAAARFTRPLDPELLAQFVTPLPIIPAMTPDTATVPGSDFYVVAAQQGVHDFGLRWPDGSEILDLYDGKPLRTTSWGYNGSYLGATIEARSALPGGTGRPVVVKYVNDLRDAGGKLLTKHLLHVDPTYDGATHGEPEIRVVPHLHGGHVAAEFDGNPEFWFGNDPAGKANGMGGPDGNSVRYTYDNSQRAATLWFHDHAMGITRLNVYAGLAAFYLVRDATEDALHLPSGPYEVPLVLQDKSFNDDGSLAYVTMPLLNPYTGEPLLDRDGNPMLSSGPEFFGNTIVVNGVVWPYLEVEPRKYRFRLLNGSDSRFYNLWLEQMGSSATAPGMVQVGNEGGLLPESVHLGTSSADGLLLGNGERADVVIDFSGSAGQTLLLRNDAAGPFPDGDAVNALTTGRIVQFRVTKPLSAILDTGVVPANPLVATPLPAPAPGNARVVDLQELTDIYQVIDGGAVGRRLELLLNGLHFHDPITETPHVGAVEDWTIVNTTGDTHPMHLHLVAFEVLQKGSYDPALFTRAASGRLPVLLPGALHPDTDTNGCTLTSTIGCVEGVSAFDPSFTVRDNEQGLKDTVRVPPGGYVVLRAKFDRLGVYMWHCHILSHEDHEMMRPFQVVP